MDKKTLFENLEEGDFILFNERKQPLKVKESKNNFLVVEGPKGGLYEIFERGEELEVSKKGNRRFSNQVKDLRKTGRWKKTSDDVWRHTGTDSEIRVFKRDTGFWDIEFRGFEPDKDLPDYGFTSRKYALEEVEKILKKNSEGK